MLNKEVREFLKENENKSATDIILKGSPFTGITSQELAQQLIGLQKTKKKLPTWYAANKVLFPPSLNLEQTSSEETAKYKSELVSGDILVDSTGGFGIDSFYFAKKMKQVIHCDLNKELQELANFNFKNLEVKNISSYNDDGIKTALKTENVDWLYIDPSRRNDVKGKVFFLNDCLPNVPEIQEACFEKTPNIMVKTAPILDISVGLSELNNVKEIHIVAVNNEVKELLWILHKNYTEEPIIKALNITKGKTFSVELPLNAEENSNATLGEVSKYLYEPFSPVMKTGAFNWLSKYYNVNKLQVNSHLYTNAVLIDFPGKVFEVKEVIKYNKKALKSLVGVKANVVTRNFKLSVADLRKKFKIKEGVDRFLFFTTNLKNEQIVIDCLRVTK